jgi:hypothetical protein
LLWPGRATHCVQSRLLRDYGGSAVISGTGATNVTIAYTWLTTGEVSTIKDGTTSLATYAYDLRGNLTSDGSNSFGYSSENLLTSASVGHVSTSFTYDPLLRLYQGVAGTTISLFAYDGPFDRLRTGLSRLAEYDGAPGARLTHRNF